MSHGADNSADVGVVGVRTMDIVVALLFIGLASVFMVDSWRTGVGWIEGMGPAPGFFPFWVSVIMAISSAVNLTRAALSPEADDVEPFVGRSGLQRVALVLVPTLIYVAAIEFLGIYVASAIFIAGFMLAFREHPLKAVAVSVGTALALFLMFEKWFLVPLPKGPLEAALGLG